MVACLGIFGIMAFQVSRRVNEIGVRMGLGATRGDIVRLVLREVAVLPLPGRVAGCLAAGALGDGDAGGGISAGTARVAPMAALHSD